MPAASICATKSLMRHPNAALVVETIGVENKQFGTMLVSAEAKEAFAAFFQKRKPYFSKYD